MSPLWRPAYVGIGSNLNDPRARVLEAFDHLQALC
jgi:7,8-dihydro-6-hydroxymethylpterin-pyrophosphokinase